MKTDWLRGSPRLMLAISAAMGCAALAWTLLERGLLLGQLRAPAYFVLAHALAIAWMQAPSPAPRTRRPLLASIAAVLIAWLPAALAVWLGLRSIVQDRFYVSPYFPLLAGTEYPVPWVWLGGYALTLPVFQYALLRVFRADRAAAARCLLAAAWAVLLWRWNIVLFASGIFRYGDGSDLWLKTSLCLIGTGVPIIVFLSVLHLSDARGARASGHDRVATRRTDSILILGVGFLALLGLSPMDSIRELGFMPARVGAVYAGFYIVIVGFILTGPWLARRGRTMAGVVATTLTLTGFFCAAVNYRGVMSTDNRPQPYRTLLDRLAHGTWNPEDEAASRVTEVVIRTEPALVNGELWLNGVDLGRLPVRLSREEFRDKVREMPKPPALVPGEDAGFKIDLIWIDGRSSTACKPWFRVSIVDEDSRYDMSAQGTRYFARVKSGAVSWFGQDDSVNTFTGRSSIGDAWHREHTTVLSIRLPERESNLKRLMTQVWLADGAPSAGWIKAMESYGSDAWNRASLAESQQQAWRETMNRWVAARYELDAIQTPDQAWAAFERIGREAGIAEDFRPVSVGPASRAVAFLEPMLDPRRLAEAAAGLKGLEDLRRSPGGDSVIEHAVSTCNALFKREHPGEPNPFQEILAPVLLRRMAGRDHFAPLALELGGREVDRFLSRTPWRAPVEIGQGNWRMLSDPIVGQPVNKHLYRAISRGDAYGRRFRLEHRDLVLELAEKIAGGEEYQDVRKTLGFLFLDPGQGDASPAMQFWPRFSSAPHPAFRKGRMPELLWKYLVAMEPLTPIDYYLNNWHIDSASTWHQFGILRSLQRDKEIAVLKAERSPLMEAVAAAPKRPPSYATPTAAEDQLQRIENRLVELGDPEAMQRLIEALKISQDGIAVRRAQIGDWLTQTRPDHPLVALLAADADPGLRRMAIGAIAEWPTTDHRALLSKLAADPDETVRVAAAAADTSLAQLAATPPESLAAPLPL